MVVESCRRRFSKKMAADQRGHSCPAAPATQQGLEDETENADETCTCLTCTQNANDDEKDLLPERREKVKWIRSNLEKDWIKKEVWQ